MDRVILTTKLQIPLLRSGLVPRARLLKQLNEGLTRKLILVSAPAGSGKTTVVADWASQVGVPLVWLSLDAGDNDPARFITYVFAAVETIAPHVTQPPAVLLQSLGPPSSVEVVVAPLVNGLAELSQDLVLVLDDYHLITSQLIHQTLTFLLDNLPPQVHLCIVARADPPIPLARLRARNQLVELRVSDLRFTIAEAADFLNRAMGLALPVEDVVELVGRAEGWITGLQLAGLSMQGLPDTQQFIAAFTGSHEYVADYLVGEVLNRQSEPLKDFLLQTSILERLNGPLCDAVTGRQDGQQTLEYLQAANLFISALDPHKQWYAYHRLFSDLLRQRLHMAHRALVVDLHRRAAEWYEQNGFPEEAIRHYLEAGDLDRAADHIADVAEATLMKSQAATLLRWVEQLPENLVRQRPSLNVYYTWALMQSTYSVAAVESRLHDIEREEPHRVTALRAFVALFQGRADDAHSLAREALERLPEGDTFLRGVTEWVRGLAGLMNSDLQASSQALGEMVRAEQAAGNLLITTTTLCNLAEIYMRQGRLQDAWNTYKQAFSLAVDDLGAPLPIAGMALIGMAELAREWNDLAEAERLVMEGIELVRDWSEAAAIDGYAVLSRLRLAQGDTEGSQAAADRAQQLAFDSDATQLDDMFICLLQARQQAMQGNIKAALDWVERSGGDPQGRSIDFDESLSPFDYHIQHHQHLTVVRIWIVEQRYDRALERLDQLLAGIERFGWLPSRRAIEVYVLKAVTLQALGRVEQALIALDTALAMAEPGGYIRTFVDEGPPMAKLLREAASRGIHPEYVSCLSAALVSSKPLAALVEPLSEREREILQLIAEGLTNRQIADRLVLAIGTVKAHTSSIYGKLGVANRVQAVARARELKLLA